MTISVSVGSFLFIIFGAIFAVTVLTMLLKKGDTRKKIISLTILIVVFISVFYFFGRPSEIVIGDNGINSDVYGKISFSWDDVESARYIENYQETGYRPVMKLNGTAVQDFRAGKFRLSNKETVKLVTQKSDNAVLFVTDKETYLFAVDELDEMLKIVKKHIEVVY